jgi:D-alanyl-D-alanine carboxypeptidase (penicillin-binding protein 5/6)
MNNQIAENGSVLPVLIGNDLTQYQALQRILIASDNNVADKMARDIFGSESAYISAANDMLQGMGLTQTTIADPSGLNPKTVSTPAEMVKIGIAALRNPVIAQIVAQQEAKLPNIPGGVIHNTNTLLGQNGVIGVKTGTTSEAGYCLLFAARYGSTGKGTTVVGVVMNSKDDNSRWTNSKKILASTKKALDLA